MFTDESNLSFGRLCQLAIERSQKGEDGQSLAEQILPLHLFPSLWSREKEYHRQEAESAVNLLLRAFGKEPLYKSASVLNSDSLPSFQEKEVISPRAKLLCFNDKVQAAFVNHGENVALGAMKCGAIEIPAFGPQLHPLNDTQLFGVHRTDTDWSAMSAQKEIWFDYACTKQGFEVRFIGIAPEKPVFFVFYVRAELALIGNDIFSPKSLQRYHHHSQKVVFQSRGDCLAIENSVASKMQLIPLAGEGCFWDSDFLIAYELPVHDARACFQFS